MRLRTLQPLTLVYRPWVYTSLASAMALGCLVGGVVRTVRSGVGLDSTWGPLLGVCLCVVVGSAASQYWTVRFDGASRLVRWRVRSVRGERGGEIGYDDVVGVAFPAARSGSRRPPRGIALVLAGGGTLRLSHYSTVHRGFERLERIGSLIRREVGIDEPGLELSVADAMTSADTDLQAVRAARDLLGVSLSEARVIAKRLRGAP